MNPLVKARHLATFNLSVAASDSEVMGSLGFACKFEKGNRQNTKEEKLPADAICRQ